MTIEVALILSILSVGFSIYFGIKNSKKSDAKDLEERVKANTTVNLKLDGIQESLDDIKEDVASIKRDIKQHNDRLIKVEESTKSAHKRLDDMQKVINDLKK